MTSRCNRCSLPISSKICSRRPSSRACNANDNMDVSSYTFRRTGHVRTANLSFERATSSPYKSSTEQPNREWAEQIVREHLCSCTIRSERRAFARSDLFAHEQLAHLDGEPGSVRRPRKLWHVASRQKIDIFGFNDMTVNNVSIFSVITTTAKRVSDSSRIFCKNEEM